MSTKFHGLRNRDLIVPSLRIQDLTHWKRTSILWFFLWIPCTSSVFSWDLRETRDIFFEAADLAGIGHPMQAKVGTIHTHFRSFLQKRREISAKQSIEKWTQELELRLQKPEIGDSQGARRLAEICALVLEGLDPKEGSGTHKAHVLEVLGANGFDLSKGETQDPKQLAVSAFVSVWERFSATHENTSHWSSILGFLGYLVLFGIVLKYTVNSQR
ncbi:hypothetical protein HOF92_07045 [bacterium]|nr:hypothetical protein [bacterium]